MWYSHRMKLKGYDCESEPATSYRTPCRMGYRAERNAGSGESLVGTRAHGADRVEVDHDLNLQPMWSPRPPARSVESAVGRAVRCTLNGMQTGFGFSLDLRVAPSHLLRQRVATNVSPFFKVKRNEPHRSSRPLLT